MYFLNPLQFACCSIDTPAKNFASLFTVDTLTYCYAILVCLYLLFKFYLQRKEAQLMKLKTHWTLILIIFVAISLSGWTQRGRSSSNPQWEYKVTSLAGGGNSPTSE